MLGLALPLLSIYALIATGVQEALFGRGDRKAGEEPPWPGPYLPDAVRRTAAVPVALIGDALFRAEVASSMLGSGLALAGPVADDPAHHARVCISLHTLRRRAADRRWRAARLAALDHPACVLLRLVVARPVVGSVQLNAWPTRTSGSMTPMPAPTSSEPT